MLGTQAGCPNTIKSHVFNYKVVCGCTRYTTMKFVPDNGYDPLVHKVRCKECRHTYYIFPALNYKEEEQQCS